MHGSAAEEMMRRGVYRAPYLVGGFEVLIAIDSKGTARKHLKLTPGVDEETATTQLRELLDRLDPIPRLVLVRDTPPENPPPRARKYPMRPIRSAAIDEKRAYWRALVRAAVDKIHVYDA